MQGANLCLFPPDSDWEPPREFPNLSGVKILGVDTETKDPNLDARGPGSFRKDGHMCGISLATSDRKWYFPMRHMLGGNMNPDSVIAFMQDVCKEERTWIGANLQYDMEWLDSDNIQMRGKFVDIQVCEALIDEEGGSVALEALSRRYLKTGKDETLLMQSLSAHGMSTKNKNDLHKLHSRFVGPYAEADAGNALEIFKCQWPEMQRQQLEQIFTLEAQVTPLLWEMRKQGIRVDLERAALLSDRLKVEEDALRKKLAETYGVSVLFDVWSGPNIARMCDKHEIRYPRTAKGNPSFAGDWLDNQEHDFLQKISSIRELDRLRGTFVDKWIFDNHVDGIIHPSWKQLASDEGGTRTGRLAASNPNPQQVPSRAELAPLIRACMIPHEDGDDWNKLDYSQQEPRLLVHFAYLMGYEGAAEVRRAYIEDPSMDIYKHLAESARITRRESKDITLGRMYDMGAPKMAAKLGIGVDAAKSKLAEFDRSVPFVRKIADLCSNKAQERGYVRTLCGRRRHFNFWEPADSFKRKYEDGEYIIPLHREAAEKMWPKSELRRAHARKALNSVIQGSAADMTKAAMVQIRRERKLIPIMQVHDELNYGGKGIGEPLKKICESCVKMEVPIRADLYIGKHWK